MPSILTILIYFLYFKSTGCPRAARQLSADCPRKGQLTGSKMQIPIWSIIKQIPILFHVKDINCLKKHIKVIWYSIPKAICQNIIEHIKYHWELCIKYNGRRKDKELLRKIPKIGK